MRGAGGLGPGQPVSGGRPRAQNLVGASHIDLSQGLLHLQVGLVGCCLIHLGLLQHLVQRVVGRGRWLDRSLARDQRLERGGVATRQLVLDLADDRVQQSDVAQALDQLHRLARPALQRAAQVALAGQQHVLGHRCSAAEQALAELGDFSRAADAHTGAGQLRARLGPVQREGRAGVQEVDLHAQRALGEAPGHRVGQRQRQRRRAEEAEGDALDHAGLAGLDLAADRLQA